MKELGQDHTVSGGAGIRNPELLSLKLDSYLLQFIFTVLLEAQSILLGKDPTLRASVLS